MGEGREGGSDEPRASQGPCRAIRYGLAGIRGLGRKAIAAIADCRPFSGLDDLILRTPVTARDLEALVTSGACDGIAGAARADVVASLPDVLKWATSARKRRKQ